MAGQAASRIILFGSECGPQRLITPVIQIKAPAAGALNDPAFGSRQSASPTAQEDKQS
ncbi:hypothetical protein ACQKLX_06665 [Bosea sp. NPDC003192]|jgi:hypothetical protein|uniref:hypothetical protein n=1 Tax=Bosea sp. NPDC003192 TaxID=3390551 RepID=UPI003CFDA2B6